MLNANELRIGNWVRRVRPNDIMHFIACQVDVVLLKSLLDDEKKYEGIELDEDLIQQCGFVKNERKKKISYSPHPPLNPEELVSPEFKRGWAYGLDRYFMDGKLSGYSFSVKTIMWSCAHTNSLLYLHQLQNIYFVLTGEELILAPRLTPSSS